MSVKFDLVKKSKVLEVNGGEVQTCISDCCRYMIEKKRVKQSFTYILYYLGEQPPKPLWLSIIGEWLTLGCDGTIVQCAGKLCNEHAKTIKKEN